MSRITMLQFEWASLFETVGCKLVEGKGLREGWDSNELWKSVEKSRLRIPTGSGSLIDS